MKNIVVVAPHPDDETLGCGGTLLRHCCEGDAVHWIIATSMQPDAGFTKERINARELEISEVAKLYGFSSVHALKFPTTKLDTIPIGIIVGALKDVFQAINPEIVYIPYPGDVHTDHRVIFDATASCAKWFRQPSIKRILAYETLSETEFGIDPDIAGFRPNVFIGISGHLERKLEILDVFAGEMGEFPFPRSADAVKAQAMLRGSMVGCTAAEAFMLLKEIL